MAKWNPNRMLDGQLECWELPGNGVGTVQTCRLIGVSLSTSCQWRADGAGLFSRARTITTWRYVSMLKRRYMGGLRAQGVHLLWISDRLGGSSPTVSRQSSKTPRHRPRL